jgi:rfaE bifunctional protein nucleotidyltransferase chain/domain
VSRVHKVAPRDVVAREIAAVRAAGRTIALANGLFDILHVGHLRYLEAAAAEADRLVVAVNADASARELKGPGRPVVPEAERAELVAGFGCVWRVVIFGEPRADALLRELRPDVHCKGTDYTAESVPEAAVAAQLGIRIAICGDPKDHASSALIDKLKGG